MGFCPVLGVPSVRRQGCGEAATQQCHLQDLTAAPPYRTSPSFGTECPSELPIHYSFLPLLALQTSLDGFPLPDVWEHLYTNVFCFFPPEPLLALQGLSSLLADGQCGWPTQHSELLWGKSSPPGLGSPPEDGGGGGVENGAISLHLRGSQLPAPIFLLALTQLEQSRCTCRSHLVLPNENPGRTRAHSHTSLALLWE